MRINKDKAKEAQPLHKPRTSNVKTKYESTKLFTLKELMKEVDKREDDHHVPIHEIHEVEIKDLNVEEFVHESNHSFDFQELQGLTESAVKPKQEEEVDQKPIEVYFLDHDKTPSTKAAKDAKDLKKTKGDVKDKKVTKPLLKKKTTEEKPKVEEKKARETLRSIREFEDRTKQFEERRKEKQKKIEEEMNKACSFKPQINKKSALLDKQRNNGPEKESKLEVNLAAQGSQSTRRLTTQVGQATKNGATERESLKDKNLKAKIQATKEKLSKPSASDEKYAITKLFRTYSERNLNMGSLEKLVLNK